MKEKINWRNVFIGVVLALIGFGTGVILTVHKINKTFPGLNINTGVKLWW